MSFLFQVKIALERYKGISDRKEKLEEVRKHQYLLPHSNCVHFYQSWEDNGRLYQKFELCQKSLLVRLFITFYVKLQYVSTVE